MATRSNISFVGNRDENWHKRELGLAIKDGKRKEVAGATSVDSEQVASTFNSYLKSTAHIVFFIICLLPSITLVASDGRLDSSSTPPA